MANENQTKTAEPTTISTPSAPATGTATVSVALKHPHGIRLQAYQLVDSGEVTPQGYRTVKVAQAMGEPFVLRGNSIAVQDINAGRMPDHLIIGRYGYAITDGVPLDLYRAWWRDNAPTLPLIKNRLIGPPPDEAGDHLRARNWATEAQASGTRSGLEPLEQLSADTARPGTVSSAVLPDGVTRSAA